MAFSSPRHRHYSDSMDCDDELVELMARAKERPFRLSDEDTEDASEDGDDRDAPPAEDRAREKGTAVPEIKEQMYHDKMVELKNQLQQLKDGVLPEFVHGAKKLLTVHTTRIEMNVIFEKIDRDRIEEDFMKEKKAALREFEDKKIELKENLLAELRERRKQIEIERTNLDLTSDTTEVKTISTRKLRRRPNEPVITAPEKRRKPPQSQITFLLDDKDVDDDILYIFNAKANASSKKAAQGQDSSSSRSKSKSPSPVAPSDIRIEDGKLFFEKRWFHRGQQIYLEGKDTPLTSAVISAISQDAIWVRKSGDTAKIRVTLSQLIKRRYSIKRRA